MDYIVNNDKIELLFRPAFAAIWLWHRLTVLAKPHRFDLFDQNEFQPQT